MDNFFHYFIVASIILVDVLHDVTMVYRLYGKEYKKIKLKLDWIQKIKINFIVWKVWKEMTFISHWWE